MTDSRRAASQSDSDAGYRSYEVFQRERPHEATPLIRPGALRSAAFRTDPYALLATLREEYPCYRDWHGNAFWVTRYDDVTSVLADEASFTFRPRAWHVGLDGFGRDLGAELPVWSAWVAGIDTHTPTVTAAALDRVAASSHTDLLVELALPVPLQILGRTLGLPDDDLAWFAPRLVTVQRGVHWDPARQIAARRAAEELADRFDALLEPRRQGGADLLAAIATCPVAGPPPRGADVVATLLGRDERVLPGALANLWCLLLTHPEQLELVRGGARLVRDAYLEAVRHSTPVLATAKFTIREVERWGRLLPEGAMVVCAAGAANRDPRAFGQPDAFLVERGDLCRREPRGQYRADGLPTGLIPGLGLPSRFPALPPDRPRSWYAVTRDTATTITTMLLDRFPRLRVAAGFDPVMHSPAVDDPYICWRLAVESDG